MKIAFDAKRAAVNMTGLGNYSRLVIEQLAETFPDDSLQLYSPRKGNSPRLSKIMAMPNVSWHIPQTKIPGIIWRTWGITSELIKNPPEIFHGLSNELPLNIRKATGVKSVVTIHDLIYRTLPQCYKPADRIIYDFKYRRACINADRIIAVSKCTARDITKIYGIDPDKIDVVYQGCDNSFAIRPGKDKLDNVRLKYSLPEKFILQVGTIELRKNLGLTIRALSALPEEIFLVAVGSGKEYLKEMKDLASRLGLEKRIVFLSNLPFEDLPAIYRLSEAVAYPSRYEGFGIPILEALQSGRPVVAAKGSCLEEAGGEGALYIDPDAPREMAEALSSVLYDTDLRKSMTAKGYLHAAKFSNSEIAAKVHAVYEKTLLG